MSITVGHAFQIHRVFLINVGNVGHWSGVVGPGGAKAVHTVARSFVFHVFQGRFEGSDHSKLRLKPGESSNPQNLA